MLAIEGQNLMRVGIGYRRAVLHPALSLTAIALAFTLILVLLRTPSSEIAELRIAVYPKVTRSAPGVGRTNSTNVPV